MEYRAPSSLATTKDGVLRRRSSVYAPQGDDYDYDYKADTPDDLDRHPTVLLVRRAPSFTPLPSLPRFSSRSPSPPGFAPPRAWSPSPAAAERTFSPVLLTPRPDKPPPPQRVASDASSHSVAPSTASASTIPPLPTPDFTRPPRFLGLFPRGLSYLSHGPAPRPLFSRASTSEPTASEGSAYSSPTPLPMPDFPHAPGFLSLVPCGLSYLSNVSLPLFSRASSSEDEASAIERPQGICSESEGNAYSSATPLPMPNFPGAPGFLSMVPRGLSYFSNASRPLFSRVSSSEAEASQRRPQSARSESEGSSSTGVSCSSTTSIDSGRHGLIKAIGTTDRFTHKWPRPQSLRTYSTDDPKAGESPVLLEDGHGVVVDAREPWTAFKWCLLFSVCTVLAYGAAALVCALMTWFRTWDQADVMFVADNDILVLLTLAGSILVFTALVGLSGVLLNSRPILAVYTILLWPAFVSLVAIGYLGYKRAAFALDHKLNMSWSQYYTPLGRLLIQDSLRCCGFYSALHEATPSKRCYPRTALPGCKGKLYRFERVNLALVWSTVFALVPLHLLNMLLALLCANHVTETFGRGITPKAYRLTSGDVQADADKIMRGVKGLDERDVVSAERLLLRRNSCGGTFREARHVEDRIPFLSYEGHQY
ncbi:hypothetical protein DFH07DRAFT_951393 [Mycena maculata]|uniref:Tetraspanin Tsp2 n=1 Tax=Mycena maculata TaxID=230809 RepID=A0AAD7K246_9AGAR|nr:hypothetical protein DFH07DRAFT_951393 [Mycena maculata]